MYIKTFISKIKNLGDTFNIFVISLTYFLTSSFFWRRTFSETFIDTGRELFIPIDMAKNNSVLYKDIVNVYGPLAYQFNAILLKIFGIDVNVLLVSGLVCGLLTVLSLYFIARLFTDKFCSLISTIFVIFSIICFSGIYMLPYAYAMSYAVMFFYLGIFFLLFYLKSSQQQNILAYLFFGASIACKPDFIAPIAIATIVIFILSKMDFRKITLLIISFLITPFFSLFLLLKDGVTISDLISSLKFMVNISKSPLLLDFYKNIGIIFDANRYLIRLIEVSRAIFFISIIMAVLILISRIHKRFEIRNTLIYISLLIGFVYLFPNIFNTTLIDILASTQIVTQLGLVVYILNYLITNKFHTELKQATINKTPWILLIILAVASMSKGMFLPKSEFYSPFLYPLTVVTSFFYFYIFSEQKPEILNKTVFKQFILVIMLIGVASWLKNITSYKHSAEVVTPYGNIITSNNSVNNLNQVSNYIKEITNKNDKVLVIPEGAIINIMTQRNSNTKLFTLLNPIYIDAYSEDNIIQEFKKDNINYIVIMYRNMEEYLPKNTIEPFFGKGYGFKIQEYINDNYKLVKIIGDNTLDEPFAKIYVSNKFDFIQSK